MQLGFGKTFVYNRPADEGEPTMCLSIGFDMAVKQTPWRLGVELGLLNQGLVEYGINEESQDYYIRPNFVFLGACADYCFRNSQLPLFARGGIGPAIQSDKWAHHTDNSVVPLIIAGLGLDFNYLKPIIQAYLSPRGGFVLTASLGLYFGD